ncbi:MAG: beta-ketoacyl-[acyl-carrier-protein] synthase family protein [Candidatus Marinimicrobia bacterium]|nr:beta-ketoacyl-[acyl-carrier-protein] synthase family protein [Candidatus Neomarinimicrobiota bacterium]
MGRRVMITGIAPVGQWGNDGTSLMKCLMMQQNLARPIPEKFLEYADFTSRFYVPFPVIDMPNIANRYKRLLSDEDKLAVAATELALQDAGIISAQKGCVIFGTGFSGLQNSFKSHLAHIKVPGETLSGRFNRFIIPMTMPNSIAAWVSILFGIEGESYTINASCASGTVAIGQAFQKIKNGECDLAVTGGIENLQDDTGSIMRGFDSLATLTRAADGKPHPFSLDRSGFLFCEGCGCVLVLEEFQQVKARRGKIYAEILDYQANSDACNIVQIDESGRPIEKILATLSSGHKIDYINTHGTGTGLNDKVEAAVIQRIFGDAERQPLINASKGILGHSIGASGALEAVVTAMALSTGNIHGNLTSAPIQNLNLVQESVQQEIHLAITTSYGFGGHNCGLLMGRFDE